jgi:hypothetical protein
LAGSGWRRLAGGGRHVNGTRLARSCCLE